MTINYQPVEVTGGTSNLPYRLEPALTAGDDRKVFAKNKPIWDYVNKLTLLIPLAVYCIISAMTLTGSGAMPVIVFTAFGTWLLSSLALRAGIPSLVGSLFLAMVYFGLSLPGATSLLIAVYVLSVVVGVRNRFTRGRVDTGLRYRAAGGLATLEQSMKPTWGTAGAHIGSNAAFGEAAKVGAKGEIAVGQALERFAKRYPYVRVFHGLCFTPGKPGADIDHVVLIGNQVVLVDAKFWAFGNYSWNRDGTVARDGAPFMGGEVHMNSALSKWRQFLGRNASAMEARITLAKDQSRTLRYGVDNGGAPRGVTLTTTEALVQELEAIAENIEPVVNRRLVYLISGELQ